jgi:hypothetical protein
MPKPPPYDFEQAARLENYVRAKGYRRSVSNSALHLYFALPHLEQKQLGLCAPITANYKTLSNAAFLSAPKLKKPLQELKGLLCEVETGHPIKGGKIATRICRYSLTELKNGTPARRLIDYEPPEALRLAAMLNSRTFIYGENPACRPFWNVSQTGRITAARPAVQNDPEQTRIKSLCAGLQPGQALISCDYKAAEPTIIQKAIGYTLPSEPYTLLASLTGTDRDSAKKQINMLAYADSAVAIVKHWTPEAQAAFTDYAEALDRYKEKRWQAGKPKNKQLRFVHTLGGSKIIAERGNPPHRGQILNWHIQGTIADLTNAACLKIIELENSKGWKLCFPEHDAVYVIGTPEQAAEIKAIMEAEAARLNLPLTVEIETFTAGGRC